MPDSYELLIIFHHVYYISAKHITKKHPNGCTIFDNICINKYLTAYEMNYLSSLPNYFEFKRGDWKFDKIDRILNRILKHEAYLSDPPSWKCVPSVMKQVDKEYLMLIYFLMECSDKK